MDSTHLRIFSNSEMASSRTDAGTVRASFVHCPVGGVELSLPLFYRLRPVNRRSPARCRSHMSMDPSFTNLLLKFALGIRF